MNRHPNEPMIVGAAAVQQRIDDPAGALDALALMRCALEHAADDAGSRDLLAAADVVLMPQGMWTTANPAQLVAPWNPASRSIVADIGVLQQTLLNRACALVASGAADIVLVCGAEAKFRSLRGQILGVAMHDPVTSGSPDERMVPAHEILTRVEIERGLHVPARQYAMIDTALRRHDGLTPAEHHDLLAEMWSGFSAIAVENPDAWNRQPVGIEAMRAAPMLAWPYTKLHCSQWNVDQAAGLVICNAAAADRHRVAADRRVFAHVGVESNLMVPMTLRRDIHRSPAMEAVDDAIAAQIGRRAADIDHIDLYSCFPAAVRVQERELCISGRPLTITGGMTFGGGPLNNYTLQSLAAMVHRLRALPDHTGLVTNVSGMLTKFGASVWSCRPADSPFRSVDVTEAAAAATAVVDVDPDHIGDTDVITYTIAFDRGTPTQGVVVGDAGRGRRVVASTDDAEVLADMLTTDWCARSVRVEGPTLRG